MGDHSMRRGMTDHDHGRALVIAAMQEAQLRLRRSAAIRRAFAEDLMMMTAPCAPPAAPTGDVIASARGPVEPVPAPPSGTGTVYLGCVSLAPLPTVGTGRNGGLWSRLVRRGRDRPNGVTYL